MPTKRSLLAFLLASLIAVPLFAWGEKGHYIANEAATYGTPADMPYFFHQAYPQLIYMSYDPDRWRGAGEALDAVNPPNHFLDYEYVEGLDLPRDRYDFIDLMIRTGRFRKYSIGISTTGFLPWRIAEVSDLLEQQWRFWRRLPAGMERSQVEQNIIAISGVLGHYVADASNPDHTTINYNGWVEPNPEHFPIDCDAHYRFESGFVANSVEVSDVLPKLHPLVPRTDYFKTALELIHESNSLVSTLYRIDRDGGFAYPYGTKEGKEFAVSRLASGASVMRDLWYSCWVNSGKSRRR
ncbi:MAG: hypothetical protein WBX15_00570 [Thermoanaerobaculia bacterium]